MLYRLLSQIDNNRFDNIVISMVEAGPVAVKIHELGIPVHALNMPRGRPTPHGFATLVRLLAKHKPVILQTWMYHANLMGLLAAKLARIPITVWNIRASNMDMSHYRRMSRWAIKLGAWLSGKPQTIIANSQVGLNFHAQLGYAPRKWALIANGINTERFKPDTNARQTLRAQLNLNPQTPLIGMAARFDPMKDHHNFLQAASHLASQHPTVHFVLLGRNMTPQNQMLQHWIEEQQLENRVHLLGLRSDPQTIMAALDIATISSSFGEGFPNAIGESMACGVPCVVTDVGDAAVIVGQTGKVAPPKNPQALALGWIELLALSPQARQHLGQRARQRIIENYSLSTIVNQYQHLYESLIANRLCVE